MRKTCVIFLGLFAFTSQALSQQCERADIKELFLTIYVCQGLINCASFGVDSYQTLLALTEQDIRDRVATKHTPARRNEAGAKYESIVHEALSKCSDCWS